MTFVNFTGLAISTAVLILLTLIVLHEVRYDRSIPNSERLVLVGSHSMMANGQELRWPIVSAGLPVDLKNEVPAIEEFVRINGSWEGENAITYDENQVIVKGVFTVDSTFFDVTGIELAQGNATEALAAPRSVVITRDFANTLFGDSDPMGEEIIYSGNMPLTVTGVIEKMPAPGMLDGMNVLISWSTYNRGASNWNNNINYYCLFKLNEKASFEDLRKGVDEATVRYFAEREQRAGYSFEVMLYPLHDVHLFAEFDPFPINSGRLNVVLQFIAMGLFLLIIAVLNYINLTTAQSLRRGMFVGIAKVLGANRAMLVRQFITEAVLITMISVLFGSLLAFLMLPTFSNLVNIQLESVLTNYALIPVFLLLAGVFLGIMMGFVPALILSNTKPIAAFKKESTSGKKGSYVRGGLVILQFGVAAGLIIGSMVVLRQMNYIRTTDIGFNRENVLTVRMSNWDLMQAYNVFYEKIKNKPYIISSSTADHLPFFGGEVSSYHAEGTPEENRIWMRKRCVDHDYIKTVGMKLIAGRNFNPGISSDSVDAVILNQTASRVLGFGDNPIGKRFDTIRFHNVPPSDEFQGGDAQVIGMIEDYHYSSLRDEIKPVYLRIYEGYPPWLIFRLQSGSEHRAIADLEDIWKEFAPGVSLQYSFLDEQFDSMYRSEQRLSKLFKLFTLVAIIVAGMGLFALSAFIAERKTKEIGVRKVLGASVKQIVTMLVSDFLKLVIIANVISWPISWWMMNSWLEAYAYRTSIEWWLFAATFGLSLFLAIIAVSVHALRASLINPVKALRDE